MRTKRMTPRTKRDAVSWFGRLKRAGRLGVIVAMQHPTAGSSFLDRPSSQVIAIGRRYLHAHEVAGVQVLALHAYHAVDLRSVRMAARQGMLRDFRIRAINHHLDLLANLALAPGEGD